jgi:hypothetical protein
MIFFYDRTEKGDLSIQVTAFIEVISLAGLTVHAFKNVMLLIIRLYINLWKVLQY